MSSPVAWGIRMFLGHRPLVTFNIHAKDSRARAKTSFPRGPRKSPSTPQQNAQRPPTPPPTAIPIFLFLVARAASREGPSSATTTGFSRGGQQPQQRHLEGSHRMANGLIRRPDSSERWTLGYPNSTDSPSSAHTAPQSLPPRPPPHERTRSGLGRADPKRRLDFAPAVGPK
jgi:hypothetical protein